MCCGCYRPEIIICFNVVLFFKISPLFPKPLAHIIYSHVARDIVNEVFMTVTYIQACLCFCTNIKVVAVYTVRV